MNRPLHSQRELLETVELPTPLESRADSLNTAIEFPPYHRPDDPVLWLAGEKLAGAGAVPPSLRRYRRNFTIACTVFTLGSLLILLSSPWRNELIAPGPLSSHHAPLAASEKGDRCMACHAAAQGSLTSWIAGIFSSTAAKGVSQSELCLKCHESSIASQFALNPHSVDPVVLAAVTTRLGGKNRSWSTLTNWASPVNGQNELACSTCHQEHHGGQQLTTLTDAQCQSCHSKTFANFEHGHPEFTNYPQQRRSRIAFDHASHFGKHFAEKGVSFDCAMCHLDDGYQNVKRLASFEQSCAQCHNDQILNSVSDGLVLLSLPMLDMQAIESAGMDVGNWPLAATGDFDGAIPPVMRVLLMADPTAQPILEARGNRFEFFDLDAENTQDVKDAVELIWAIKRLLANLSDNGPSELKRRFELVLNLEVEGSELSRLITTLDHSVFFTMTQAWLPDLALELQQDRLTRHHESHTDPVQARQRESTKAPFFENHPGAIANQSPFSLASQTRLSLNSQDDLLAVNPLVALMKQGSGLDRGLENQRAQSNRPPIQSGIDLAKTGRPMIDSGSVEAESLPSSEDVLQASPRSDLAAVKRVELSEAVPRPFPPNDHNQVLFDNLNRPSGWYRDDSTLQISYRAAGHADPCLKAWIDFVARIPSLENRAELKPLLSEILATSGIGQCQSCHTIDRVADERLKANWLAEYREPTRKGFTKFSHGPHLVHVELKDCSKCHELVGQRSNAHSFVSFDPSDVVSNFRPIVKSDCLQCHQQGRTNSSCMQCHHYHVHSALQLD